MADSSQHHTTAGFSAENEDLMQYREVSRLAIGGMILGILSVMAVFTSVLWIVPVLAIVLCLVAYYQIGRSDLLTGQGMALAGMGLAAIWLGLSFTQAQVKQHALVTASREMASDWIDLILQKKIMEAHQFSMPPSARPPAKTALAAFYAENDMRKEDLEAFESRDMVHMINEWDGGPLEATYVRDYAASAYEGTYYVTQIFRISDKENNKPLWDVKVAMKRQSGTGDLTGSFVWIAEGISLEKAYR
ncbi:DUF4190 domain-containing protein [Blastopirellula marina]|uniref:Uncharacterized protein n=1 Tax=Blastopirellula marina TaxID=124 RepID=A0A2S8F5F7_9BACT|nr:DUF4190 domain-containing protein [Blastopirellula marina]PQO27164.1 hypothetical protein C5Y98_28375 [Blastopirellula marina]PTL41311.1 DUF4190 domain-containing protein [Blastopirellula marina]